MGDFCYARKLRVSSWRKELSIVPVLGSCKGLHQKVITELVEVSGTVNPRTTKSGTADSTVRAGV